MKDAFEPCEIDANEIGPFNYSITPDYFCEPDIVH